MKRYLERMQEQLNLINMLRNADVHSYCLEVSSSCGPTMMVRGKEVINFISNSYMGFSIHPKVIEAAKKALDKFGMGIGGSPLACGTTTLHLQLAEVLAQNYGKEDAIIFASGYQALAGTIQGMLGGKGDIALLDNLSHRSIIDGCILARCKMRSFLHNNAEDLQALVGDTNKVESHRMVIVDSVYSMDGDTAPLPELVKICQPAGVTIMIDEAHSLGILGKTGKGLLEHFDLPDGAQVVAGTFSKFAGAVGGFCAADRNIIDFLRHFSSPFVFSASLPPATAAAVLASFDLLKSEPQWHQQLWDNVHFMLNNLKELGFDTGKSSTPCIPIMVRDTEKTLRMNRVLLEKGVFCSPVVHPGVQPRTERLRLGLMASHTRSNLEHALEIIRQVGREFELISS